MRFRLVASAAAMRAAQAFVAIVQAYAVHRAALVPAVGGQVEEVVSMSRSVMPARSSSVGRKGRVVWFMAGS